MRKLLLVGLPGRLDDPSFQGTITNFTFLQHPFAESLRWQNRTIR